MFIQVSSVANIAQWRGVESTDQPHSSKSKEDYFKPTPNTNGFTVSIVCKVDCNPATPSPTTENCEIFSEP